MGLDAATNAADSAKWPPDHPLNPNLNGLNWSWQGGYVFLAIEGHYRSGKSGPERFCYHLARDPNRPGSASSRRSILLTMRASCSISTWDTAQRATSAFI